MTSLDDRLSPVPVIYPDEDQVIPPGVRVDVLQIEGATALGGTR